MFSSEFAVKDKVSMLLENPGHLELVKSFSKIEGDLKWDDFELFMKVKSIPSSMLFEQFEDAVCRSPSDVSKVSFTPSLPTYSPIPASISRYDFAISWYRVAFLTTSQGGLS